MGIEPDWRGEFSPWALASVLLYLLSAQALRLNLVIRALTWLADHGALEPIWWGVRLAYLAGLPYLALLAGAASPRGMGLIGLDWVRTFGLGVPLAIMAWVLIWIGWRQAHLPPSGLPSVYHRGVGMAGWLSAALEAGGQQMHWAFYRDAWTRWWDPYWGAWASLLTVGLEWVSGSWSWRGRRAPLQMLITNVLLALITTALHLLVSNWWLNWGLHMLTLFSTRTTIRPTLILPRWQTTGNRP